MSKSTLFVGLDTAKDTIAVAVAEPLPFGEVRAWGKIANTPASLERLIKQLRKGGRTIKTCYEAGPCGYGIYRQLAAMADVSCVVAAPSRIPRAPGERVKTDRRDALKLATLLRAEEIVAVWVPDAAHEAIRDLVRARAMAVEDLTRCRQRIGGFLLRQGIVYAGKPWTKKHRDWLAGLAFDHAAQRLMFAEFLVALDQAAARRDRLTDHIAEQVPSWSLAWLVEALQALRGYRLVHAATLAAEIGDPRRFASPRQLMGFVGLVPSEHTTADRVRRGPITKTGNGRARKVLIEAGWSYAHAAKGGAITAPPAVAAIAEKARHRLTRRYRQLIARGKRAPVAVTAIARESLGFIWAIARAAAPLAAPPAGGPRSQP
ncbi:MAG TPA: IS110 family transposase [Alphaproteobacteria bacterium]|jgi:transposase